MRLESSYAQKQQQKQSVKLAMTQQLTQSIAMLQYTTADLQSFLEEKALENPLIEVISGNDIATDFSAVKKQNYADDNDWLEQVADTRKTLADVLKEQLALIKLPENKKIVVLYLIESLDDAGYLAVDIETISTALLMDECDILAGLEILQSMEPAGVGARDAQECLLLQIERSADAPEIAYDVIANFFSAFAEKKWRGIAEALGVHLNEIQAVSDCVQTLNPKPGAEFAGERIQYVVPDLILRIVEGKMQVSIAKRFLPQIRFQEEYYRTMKATKEKDVTQFLKEKTGEYDWLIKGMIQRESTLQRVGKAVVARQKHFFLNIKEKLLAPLTLKEIAEELGIHESTVSRAVNGKYIETPNGIYELKYFFNSSLQKKSSTIDEETEDVSSAAIKTFIQTLIEQEDKQKPLSDQKIVDLLAPKNIVVSRRAIAKYRRALHIPSSAKRKRFD